MKVFRSFRLPEKYYNSSLAIGNFDGVHIGHQAVIKTAKLVANKKKSKLGVLTFEPHPKCFFAKKYDYFILTTFREKYLILKKFNIDFMITIRFNSNFLKISADDFIIKQLVGQLHVGDVITGFDFVFGNKKKGNIKLLKYYSNKTKKFNFHEVAEIKKKNFEISSSIIRDFLRNGEISKANKILSRNWSISSRIIYGNKNGRTIGFKTANIQVNQFCNIEYGVYLVKVQIPKLLAEKSLFGIANYGVKPTVKNQSPLLEVHIFNFNEEIYRQRIRVEFLRFIRHEKKFDSLEKLKSQIIKDIKQAKNDRLFKNN